MQVRDRVKELRRVPAKELRANPKNWRTHPNGQRGALREILNQVGIASALIAYESDDGLTLLDGHLRSELDGDREWPVLVLDVTEEEADLLLATLDPLAAMADADAAKLAELLPTLELEGEFLAAVLGDLAADNGLDELLEGFQVNEQPGQHTNAELDDSEQPAENPYTDKVEVPPYAKIGDKPELSQCFDDSYCRKLLDDIDASDVAENEKHFLRAAAYRHVVFNFQEIANYYAHSDADVQQLMEDSALVIVDLDSAIKNGWTRLSKALDAIYADETEVTADA